MFLTSYSRRAIQSIVPERFRWPLKKWASRATHFGTGRFCPCCNSHVRRFCPYGVTPRPEARCPVCGALERHRLATLFLGERDDLLDNTGRVLHVAPEPPVARLLRRCAATAYVSVDLIADDTMVQADLTRMPFGSRSFDGIYCSHVLEHVPRDQDAMVELHRILRPGGWAVFQIPVTRDVTFEDPTIQSPKLRRRLFGQSDHVRHYGRDVADRLARARFSVTAERPQRQLDAEAMTRFGLNETEDIFLCKK